MAKPNNMLLGWTRQLRAAIDEGAQEAYEAAEVLADTLELVTTDGDDDMEDAEPGGRHPPDGAAGRPDQGDRQLHLRGPEGVEDTVRGDLPPTVPDGRAPPVAGARPGVRLLKEVPNANTRRVIE